MVTEDEAKLIAEYEKLRDRLFELDALATAIDHRLIEIERKLPRDYALPQQPPTSKKPPRGKKPGPR